MNYFEYNYLPVQHRSRHRTFFHVDLRVKLFHTTIKNIQLKVFHFHIKEFVIFDVRRLNPAKRTRKLIDR